MRDRGFAALLVASLGLFFGFSLLMSVVPLWVVGNGAGELAAGAATGGFMATTVVAQLLMPALIDRAGYRAVSIAGALLLGLPAALLPMATTWEPVLAISLVRGLGFGIVTVAGSALIAELLPAGSRGRGSGLYGAAVGTPMLVGFPLSVWVAQHVDFLPVFAAGALLPVLAIVPLLALPGVAGGARPVEPPALGDARAVWRPWLPMLAGSIAFGALATFLPLMFPGSPLTAAAALLVTMATAMGGRWVAGVVGDRSATVGRWLFPGLAVIGLGLIGIAAGVRLTGLAAAVVGIGCVAVYGIGFGVVQNDSLVVMFRRVSAARASVAWNVAFDAGQGIGAVVVGAVAAASSFSVAFVVLGAFALALLPVARGGHPKLEA